MALILYANIVGAIQGTFFPEEGTNVLKVYIAWLNLDLGFETCFLDGLNGYWKTWLQFAFPVYIWTIAACRMRCNSASCLQHLEFPLAVKCSHLADCN